ncbi:MAG: molecular chaperone HtpG [Pseudomonadota bacterium]|nr:molecular chaperone HtpG [Pseudomonadota bacterium]
MSAERHEFQAETRSLLRLMIHSMYSNKEIFLRELVSNASDACDKLRFLSIQQPELAGEGELAVELAIDKEAGTLTVRDNGVGMSRQEVIDNLGTIARSGTKQFMEQLSGDQAKDSQLIGQFGVGFYSAFIVADKVTVRTRRAGADEAVVWESAGEGEYSLEACDKEDRGTEVVLHIRDDDKEFLEPMRLENVVRKYSDHIGLPIRLKGEGDAETRVLNEARALWTRPKSELSDEDYTGFYQHIAHDFQPPLAWAHHRVEGNLEYTSLLYIPSQAPFDLYNREQQHGVKLYVKRVFILDRADELLPNYLRFVRGLVDTADLPLNVSREILQSNRVVDKIRSALVKRVLDLLDDMAEKRPEDYAKFWTQFGRVLKEGVVEDPANSERIAKLLRFNSTQDSAAQTVTLADYVSRMPEGQEKILYLTGESLPALKNSPHLEGFRKAGYAVLLLADRVDEWVVTHLTEFDGKPLESAARGDAEAAGKIETPDKARFEAEFAEVVGKLPEALGGRIESARLSARLTESPSCLVVPENGMSRQLLEILKQAGEAAPETKPILEINPEHPLVERLKRVEGEAFGDLAEVLFGQAVLAEGAQLDDPSGFVKRLNKLILQQTESRLIL